MKKFAVIMGVLASAICLLAGIWILSRTGLTFSLEGRDDAIVWEAMGLYFIGKACFVGPMLIVAGLKQ
ncbi:MAG TPA: hypothetical protein VMZ92_10725 [Planctomycetota bacterium]|nr:hypothetical protein [Planctomycetota bacterium]